MKITQISFEDVPVVLRVMADRLGSGNDSHSLTNVAQHLLDVVEVLRERAELSKILEDDEEDD